MPLSKKQLTGIGVGVGVIGVGLVALLAKASGWEPEPPEPGKANVYGTVTEAVDFFWQDVWWARKGDPIPGATVFLETASSIPAGAALTDSDGKYLIENVEPGNYTLRVLKVNHHTVTGTISVKQGNNKADVSLERYWPG